MSLLRAARRCRTAAPRRKSPDASPAVARGYVVFGRARGGSMAALADDMRRR